MKPFTTAWVKKAEDDYKGAVGLSRRRKDPLPDLICFHCQQCAEKYLKALLQERQIQFAKTHDLEDLLNSATTVDRQLNELMRSANELNEYSIDFRYPGKSATAANARGAMSAVRAIRAVIRRCLGIQEKSRRSRRAK